MDDEQKALKAIDRARRAEALVNDDLLKEAFAEIDARLIERWRSTEDPLARDALWQAVVINEQIQTSLKNIIKNGRVAKSILDNIEKLRSESRQTVKLTT